jgi:hypothetical protein
MTLEGFLESDFAGAGYLEPFFCTRIGFNLWHFLMMFVLIPCWRPALAETYGAVWAMAVIRIALMRSETGIVNGAQR